MQSKEKTFKPKFLILTKIVQHSIIAQLLMVAMGSPYFARKLLDFHVNIALFLNTESFVNRNPQNRIRRAADICTYGVQKRKRKNIHRPPPSTCTMVVA